MCQPCYGLNVGSERDLYTLELLLFFFNLLVFVNPAYCFAYSFNFSYLVSCLICCCFFMLLNLLFTGELSYPQFYFFGVF
jgi:hypothetical protein